MQKMKKAPPIDSSPCKRTSLWMLIPVLVLLFACEEPTRRYLKARSPEELKTGAYDMCSRDYKVLSYEDDTALVECLAPLKGN